MTTTAGPPGPVNPGRRRAVPRAAVPCRLHRRATSHRPDVHPGVPHRAATGNPAAATPSERAAARTSERHGRRGRWCRSRWRRGAAGGYAAGRAAEEREPELITHRAYNGTGYDDDPYDDYGYDEAGYDDRDDLARSREPGYDTDDADDDGAAVDAKGKPVLSAAERKKRRWRRIRRAAYAFVGVFLVLPALAFAVTYFFVDVPTPEEVAAEQGKVVTYYFSNGKEMGRDVPPEGHRIILKPEDIPR
ncbi:hypothetical protein ACFSVJ_15725 [Prauserella oleivorans]